jgi:hypothetical protein
MHQFPHRPNRLPKWELARTAEKQSALHIPTQRLRKLQVNAELPDLANPIPQPAGLQTIEPLQTIPHLGLGLQRAFA